jgi:hypothetical protein
MPPKLLMDLDGFLGTVYLEDISTTPPPHALDETPSDNTLTECAANDSNNGDII